jgi:hypothetical protein
MLTGRSVSHGKAANGEGSLYRDSGGAWRATYYDAGEAQPRRVRGRTREEAMARRAAKLEELASTQYDGLQDHARRECSDSSPCVHRHRSDRR